LHVDKPPIIERARPAKNERYDLDDPNQLKLIGVTLQPHLPRADEYSHYPHCEWAIIESKGNGLRNSIEQLESTAKQILTFKGKKIDRAIIIASKINKKEKRVFTKRGNVLYLKKNDKPVLIPADSIKIQATLYSPEEIEKQYQEFGRTLDYHMNKSGGF
jgi:hypothetical protein